MPSRVEKLPQLGSSTLEVEGNWHSSRMNKGKLLQDKQIIIRPATADDSARLLLWRNDPVTRENSLTTEPVSKDNHEQWFSSTLQREDRVIYIADISSTSNQQDSCGMCRFDISQDGKSAVVSINLNPQYRGEGLSLPILMRSIGAFAQQFQGITILDAEIRESNLPSIHIFSQAGFAKINVDSEVGHYSFSVNRGTVNDGQLER